MFQRYPKEMKRRKTLHHVISKRKIYVSGWDRLNDSFYIICICAGVVLLMLRTFGAKYSQLDSPGGGEGGGGCGYCVHYPGLEKIYDYLIVFWCTEYKSLVITWRERMITIALHS